jgi:hypothetical protein
MPQVLRKLGIIAVLCLIAGALAAPALAVNPHEVPNDLLVCQEVQTAQGPAVECSGAIAGLGGAERVTITVDAELACQTRSGSNEPGGHLQATTLPLDVQGGKTTFDVTTAAAECPPGLNPVVGETATITVREFPSGEVLAVFTEEIL